MKEPLPNLDEEDREKYPGCNCIYWTMQQLKTLKDNLDFIEVNRKLLIVPCSCINIPSFIHSY